MCNLHFVKALNFKRAYFIIVVLLLFVIGYRIQAQSQQLADTLKKQKSNLISGFPVVFYTPETRLGIGASGVWIFKFKKDSTNAQRSSIYLGFAITQNKQAVVNLPFNLFIRNRLYHVYGELGYNHLNYNFYGVGNEVPPDFSESYGIDFPRLRLSVLKKVWPHLYLGLRCLYDKNTLYDLDSTGLLIQGDIPGSQGGTVSGFGGVALFDTRDDVFYPSRGWYSEFVVFRSDQAFGSDFNYNRIALDVSYYVHLRKNIFAFNVYSVYSNTNLPFFQMANLGGSKKMRGFYEGRYRDNNLLMLQAEYRRHLFWQLGFTIFADIGQVSNRYDAFQIDQWRYTYGAGLRLGLDEKQKINLRLDVAVGDGKVLPYFTIGEAF